MTAGSSSCDGNIFSIKTDGTGYKDLLDFINTNGDNPQGSLALSAKGNVLYGMTLASSGQSNKGLVFSINTDGSGYKYLLGFNGFAGGKQPYGSLTLSGNELYGMTSSGGSTSAGVIFSIDTTGNVYNELYDFNTATGAKPEGSLTLSGNVLYGMTDQGGANGDGVIFKFGLTTAGINEVNKEEISDNVNVYPNPVTDNLQIQTTLQIKSIDVSDITGRLLFTTTSKVIDCSSFAKGVYFITLTTENGKAVKKFVKE